MYTTTSYLALFFKSRYRVLFMPSFRRRGTFWSAALVLALALWASGAPSILYPVYAAQWSLPPVVTTSVFAAYPFALLVMLLVAGGIADLIGRRRAMLLGIALVAVGAVLFAVAPHVAFLFAGRLVQGVGVGFAMSAASAALVEHSVFRSPRAASATTTVATSGGLTIALVGGGALAQLIPLPLVVTYAVLVAFAIVTFVLVALTPDDRPATAPAWRPTLPRIAPDAGRDVLAAVIGVVVAFSVGAVFLSLGAQMAHRLTGTDDLLVIGAILGLSSATIGATALLIGRVPSRTATLVGGVVSLAGLGAMAATASTGSLAWFVVWCVVGGVGYSLAFTGGVGLAASAAGPEHRAGTFSLVYLVAYLFQTVVAIGGGALATSLGLATAVDVMAPIVGALAVALVIVSIFAVVPRRQPLRERTVS
jgi:predicted MFS family arabinose efflux permease